MLWTHDCCANSLSINLNFLNLKYKMGVDKCSFIFFIISSVISSSLYDRERKSCDLVLALE